MLKLDTALMEEARELAVDDRGADLRLDVVADDRKPRVFEALAPVVLARDEYRQAVDEPDARLERLLDVPLGRGFGADREVADENVRLRLLEDADDVRGLARGLGDLLLEVLAKAVVRHAAMDLNAHVRDVGELDRVVLARPDRLGEILADLLGIDVEGSDELDVADVIAAEVHVHEAGDLLGGIGVLVVLDALDEAVGAVADTDDRDADLAIVGARAVLRRPVGLGRSVGSAHLYEIPFEAGSGKRLRSRDDLVTPRRLDSGLPVPEARASRVRPAARP